MSLENSIPRREFLRRIRLAGGALAYGKIAAAQAPNEVSLILNPADDVASAAPAQWAARELQQALADSGMAVTRRERPEEAPLNEFCVVVCGARAPVAAATMKIANVIAPEDPESLVLLSAKVAGRQALLVCASDARGLVYALLELADRARHPMGSRGTALE